VKFRDRSAADLAVLGIVVIVGVILIVNAVGLLVIGLLHPSYDIEPLIRAESEILGVLVGALVGFIGGRAQGRAEQKQEVS
jgi:membrane protein DedA with SNARE-associated domain